MIRCSIRSIHQVRIDLSTNNSEVDYNLGHGYIGSIHGVVSSEECSTNCTINYNLQSGQVRDLHLNAGGYSKINDS